MTKRPLPAGRAQNMDYASPVYKEGVVKILDGINAPDDYYRILLGNNKGKNNIKIKKN